MTRRRRQAEEHGDKPVRISWRVDELDAVLQEEDAREMDAVKTRAQRLREEDEAC